MAFFLSVSCLSASWYLRMTHHTQGLAPRSFRSASSHPCLGDCEFKFTQFKSLPLSGGQNTSELLQKSLVGEANTYQGRHGLIRSRRPKTSNEKSSSDRGGSESHIRFPLAVPQKRYYPLPKKFLPQRAKTTRI